MNQEAKTNKRESALNYIESFEVLINKFDFFIMGYPRTGTCWYANAASGKHSLVNNHNETHLTVCYHEIFPPDVNNRPLWPKKKIGLSCASLIRALKEIVSSGKPYIILDLENEEKEIASFVEWLKSTDIASRNDLSFIKYIAKEIHSTTKEALSTVNKGRIVPNIKQLARMEEEEAIIRLKGSLSLFDIEISEDEAIRLLSMNVSTTIKKFI